MQRLSGVTDQSLSVTVENKKVQPKDDRTPVAGANVPNDGTTTSVSLPSSLGNPELIPFGFLNSLFARNGQVLSETGGMNFHVNAIKTEARRIMKEEKVKRRQMTLSNTLGSTSLEPHQDAPNYLPSLPLASFFRHNKEAKAHLQWIKKKHLLGNDIALLGVGPLRR